MYTCKTCGAKFDDSRLYGCHIMTHKNKENAEKRQVAVRATYELSPKICPTCNRAISYEHRSNKFCSQSCAATYNNVKRISKSTPEQVKEEAERRIQQPRKEKVGTPEERKLAGIEKHKETWKKKRILVEWECPQCHKKLQLTPREAAKRKYCSGTCRNLATNPAKNGSISKAETLLCNLIEAAGYVVDRNRRDILNGLEIDIWIPALQTGIEYNGVYHLQPIHGDEMLQRIQAKDELKKKLAEKLGIRLIVVEDAKSTPTHIRNLGKKVLQQLSKG